MLLPLSRLSRLTGPRRLLVAAAAGIVVGAVPYPLGLAEHLLLGWISAALVYLLLAGVLAAGFEVDEIRSRAREQDESAAVLFLIMVVAVCVAAAAIGSVLLKAGANQADDSRALHIVLALLALAASWIWIQTLYAFHYAHRYYQSDDDAGEKAAQDDGDGNGGGLDFPGRGDPDYFDFFYYATVVGMTSQVSDVQITSGAMRRLTTAHAMLSFAFNLVLLAIAVNAVAGSVTGG